MTSLGPLVRLDRQFLVDLYFDEESRRFTAVIPELPGCVSEGDTLAESRALVIEAASLYFESLSDMRSDLPCVFPPPFNGLQPRHSTVVGLRDIASVMELPADHYMGGHVAISNATSGKVVVFPAASETLSSTTLTLLVHYAGIDAVQFLRAIREAETDSERHAAFESGAAMLDLDPPRDAIEPLEP